ncbi:MAG: hypothetical protein KGJ77_05255 [Acidobacteriota bacterium]|nr:hypothetical protein [Acidobacteriota bacterium]
MVRVVPDVAGIRKAFDYLVPGELADAVEVGASVRVLLGRRRVTGWVVADSEAAPPGVTLHPLLAVRSWGPPAPVVELARWASWRWAGPLARLLATASPPTLVRALPAIARRAAPGPDAGAGAVGAGAGDQDMAAVAAEALGGGAAVVRLAPAHDPFPVVEAAARLAVARGGGALVLCPAHRTAERVGARLGVAGYPVALLPDQWARARAGGVVAVGTRAGAFAPLPEVAAVVVLDAHDQAYHEERAPTWAAWEVAAERARRAGVPCALVSACPTLDLLRGRRLVLDSRRHERAGWPSVEVVDRRADDPRSGLYSERLVTLVRWAAAAPGRRVLCVLNRTGRARLLACAACGELVRCERCGGAMAQAVAAGDATGRLACGRCGEERPELCAACGSLRLRVLRMGISRVREEIEALAGAPVAEVSATTGQGTGDEDPGAIERAPVVVGTEAVLHRLRRADAVCFLDIDAELLAPRLRAAEQTLALLGRGARVVGAGGEGAPGTPAGGPGRAPGRLFVQTRLPDHPALLAAVHADPGLVAAAEEPVRAELGLPPFAALALVSGPAADAYGAALAAAAPEGVEVRGPADGVWSVRAPDHGLLADLLAAVERPGGRLRVEVDPVRA